MRKSCWHRVLNAIDSDLRASIKKTVKKNHINKVYKQIQEHKERQLKKIEERSDYDCLTLIRDIPKDDHECDETYLQTNDNTIGHEHVLEEKPLDEIHVQIQYIEKTINSY